MKFICQLNTTHLAARQQITYTSVMVTKPKSETDKRSQRQKFIDAAREHGADSDQDTFRRVIAKVATAPPGKPKKAATKSK